MDVSKKRIPRIYSGLTGQIDAILLMNGEEPHKDLSFFYATGYDSGLFEGCIAILWPDGGVEVLSSALEETSARARDVPVKVYSKKSQRDLMLKESLRGMKSIGINGAALTVRDLEEIKRSMPGIKTIDVSSAIEKARLVKDEEEVERMREACRIASRVADEIPNFLEVGMKEYEAAAEIVYMMQRKGASSISFETISCFGKNSAEPHHMPDDSILTKGSFALFDFGAKFRLYCSDITRTFIAGKATKQQVEMYHTVLEMQRVGLENIRAGVNGMEVDAAARAVIERSGTKGTMPHSLGHGLGLSVHDGGRMAPEVDLKLEENMILTVEPGLYIPGYGGIRIEDVVRVKANGCDVLTTASKELTVI